MTEIKPKMVDGDAVCNGENCPHFSQYSRTDWICDAVHQQTDPAVVLPEESVCVPWLRARVAELEAQLAAVRGDGGPWPLDSVLRTLADAAAELLDDHDYDGTGHEDIRRTIRRADEIHRALTSSATASEGGE